MQRIDAARGHAADGVAAPVRAPVARVVVVAIRAGGRGAAVVRTRAGDPHLRPQAGEAVLSARFASSRASDVRKVDWPDRLELADVSFVVFWAPRDLTRPKNPGQIRSASWLSLPAPAAARTAQPPASPGTPFAWHDPFSTLVPFAPGHLNRGPGQRNYSSDFLKGKRCIIQDKYAYMNK